MRGSVAAEVTSLVIREQVHEQIYATRVPDGPPRPPPGPIGMASSPEVLVSKALPKPRPQPPNANTTTVDEVRRKDLTTIAIHPYEPGSIADYIFEIRSHHLDPRYTECDEILMGFSKTMTCILRNVNHSAGKGEKVSCVDKTNWMHNIIWPMPEFTKWFAWLIYFNHDFKNWNLRRVFQRCFPEFPFRQHITNNDWGDVDIPANIVLQWLSICSFGRPRFATLCTAKCNDEGRVVVDWKIGVAAIQ